MRQNRTACENQRIAGQAVRVSAVAVDVLKARCDVRVAGKSTFNFFGFFGGLDKLKPDDREEKRYWDADFELRSAR